jgi:tetratricopeptide (TPR) repeat protein
MRLFGSSTALWLVAALLFSALGLTATHGAAQAAPEVAGSDEEARALFEAGRVAFTAGRFGDALSHFTRSYELSGRPELLFNIASAEDRLRRDASAIEHYQAFLTAVPDAENRPFVEERLAFLRAAAEPAPAPVAPPIDGVAAAPAGSDDWWIWTLVAVGVVGAGVAIGVGVGVAASGTEPPYGGTAGFTITALRFE